MPKSKSSQEMKTTELTPPVIEKDSTDGDLIISWTYFINPELNPDPDKVSDTTTVSAADLAGKLTLTTDNEISAEIDEQLVEKIANEIVRAGKGEWFKLRIDNLNIDVEEDELFVSMDVKDSAEQFVHDMFGGFKIAYSYKNETFTVKELIEDDGTKIPFDEFSLRGFGVAQITRGMNRTIPKLTFEINDENFGVNDFSLNEDEINLLMEAF